MLPGQRWECEDVRPVSRGLLCFHCNTAAGYVELYRERAGAYLARGLLLVDRTGLEPVTSSV